MATHATVVAFCDTHIRSIADKYTSLILEMELAKNEYNAQGIAALLGADGDQIEDGSGEFGDGRPQGTVLDLKNVITESATILAACEASSYELGKKFFLWAVNPKDPT